MRFSFQANQMSLFRFASFICLGLSVPTHAAESNQSAIAQRVFEQAKSKVFQIKSAISPEAPKASYGSAWVIDKSGLLITNYHVTSQAIQKPKSYELYLMVNERPVPATVLAVDVIHDLAVVKVDETFSSALEVAATPPVQGAKIFSIGLPEDLNMAITEGNYNNIVEYGPYQLVHMASPLNPGMSGGPTLNTSAEVIGVNVSVLMSRQSISFAVPNRYLAAVLKRARESLKEISAQKSNEARAQKIQSEIESQLLDVQNHLTSDALSPKEVTGGKGANVGVPRWKIQPLSTFLKCWSDTEDNPKSQYDSVRQICYVPHAAFIDDRLTSGSYEISWQTLSAKKLNNLQLYQIASDEFNSDDRYISLFLKSFSEKDDLLTRYSCKENLYESGKNILYSTSTCMRGYAKYSSLLNIDFKALTLSKTGQLLLFRLALSGFTLENAKKMIEKSIESIEVQ